MKKILAALLLSSLLALSLASCGGATEDAAGSGTGSRIEASSEAGGLINEGPAPDDGNEWGELIGLN